MCILWLSWALKCFTRLQCNFRVQEKAGFFTVSTRRLAMKLTSACVTQVCFSGFVFSTEIDCWVLEVVLKERDSGGRGWVHFVSHGSNFVQTLNLRPFCDVAVSEVFTADSCGLRPPNTLCFLYLQVYESRNIKPHIYHFIPSFCARSVKTSSSNRNRLKRDWCEWDLT